MKIEIQREQLLHVLQYVIGVVERRQTLPILGNVRVVAEDNTLALSATDLEVELSATISMIVDTPGRTTLPGRKLLEILRALPEQAAITLTVEANKALLRCGRSRFSLTTLPADEMPTLDQFVAEQQLNIAQATLRTLIERTHFAMAQQDVRYYLNGLLLAYHPAREAEVEAEAETTTSHAVLKAVATDGHRLALSEIALNDAGGAESIDARVGMECQVIVPRKGIQELLRLLSDTGDAQAVVKIGSNHIRIELLPLPPADGETDQDSGANKMGTVCFTSKLIDGKFPDYQRALPAESERVVIADRALLRNALQRTAILANENRGVRLQASEWLLRIQANNPEQEEAEEELEVNFQGESLEIGFNVTYLLDALAALQGELIKLFLTDANTSCLVREAESLQALEHRSQYVISPMRL